LVPSAKIQASIGSRDDRVGSVFTTAGHGDDPFDFFELLISVEVLESVESGSSWGIFLIFVEDSFAVDVYVQAVFGVQESLGHPEVDVDRIDFGIGWVTRGAGGNSIELAVLVRDDQAAFEVDTHGDPGSLFFGGDFVHEFSLKAFRKSKA
jgi:hypothetical protein